MVAFQKVLNSLFDSEQTRMSIDRNEYLDTSCARKIRHFIFQNDPEVFKMANESHYKNS